MISLNDSVIRGLRVVKVFRESADRVNAIDFSQNGSKLICTSDDDHVILYDCLKGVKINTISLKKYGCNLGRFVQANNHSILHASSKLDDTIRYLDFEGNKYLRYFPGHTQKVVSLAVSPAEDIFITGSLDKTLRFWDLRTPNCKGLMHLSGRPLATFDPAGLVFAVGINSEFIKLYDVRAFGKGPFANFKYNVEKNCDWTHIKISPDGKTLLVCTNKSIIRLIDAFHGTLKHSLVGHANSTGLPIEASFSSDSQYIVSGSSDGKIHCWSCVTGQKICSFDADHPGAVLNIQFNPKLLLLCTACTNVALWIPTNIEQQLKHQKTF